MDEGATYRLVVEYDGARFSGWQVQPGRRTVQGEVERALGTVLREPVRVVAAGRTDAGVHALGQVVSFTAPADVDSGLLVRALNGVLPRDVAVITAAAAPNGFNARYDAVSRTYRYLISTRRRAVGGRYSWFCRYRLDFGLMREATEPLKGPCDLRAFSKGPDDDDYSTVILGNDWTEDDDMFIFTITAVRFFHHAVRSIVGSAVEVGRGKVPTAHLGRMIAVRDRKLAGPTAPACGLCLVNVDYGKE